MRESKNKTSMRIIALLLMGMTSACNMLPFGTSEGSGDSGATVGLVALAAGMANNASASTTTGTGTSSTTSLTYLGSPFSFTNGIAISRQTPIVTGTVTACAANPNLPTGLTISTTTCAISGTPTLNQAATDYTITATSSSGTLTATISITIQGAIVSTFAGSGASGSTDGTGTSASFSGVSGITTDSSGNLYVIDGARIRKINSSGVVTTLAGTGIPVSNNPSDGTGTAASFGSIGGITVDTSGNIFVTETGYTYFGLSYSGRIRKVTPQGVVTTVAGSGLTFGAVDGLVSIASFGYLQGITVDSSGSIYVADSYPLGLMLSSSSGNQKIRKLSSNGVVTTMAGSGTVGSSDGTGTAACFITPTGIVVDSSGNLFVTDSGNYKIRKITPDGVVTTIAGGTSGSTDGAGTAASFNYPTGIAIDSAGSLYVSEGHVNYARAANQKIRKITSTGIVTTIAGIGFAGATDGPGSTATFNNPQGIVVDSTGVLFVADSSNHKIRKIVQ